MKFQTNCEHPPDIQVTAICTSPGQHITRGLCLELMHPQQISFATLEYVNNLLSDFNLVTM